MADNKRGIRIEKPQTENIPLNPFPLHQPRRMRPFFSFLLVLTYAMSGASLCLVWIGH